MFSGRMLLIASMHEKEKVIAPIFEKNLLVKCKASVNFNTDALGTFSGEIERTLSPIDAAKAKCKMAYEQTGVELVVASEGSFGTHPTIFFAPADEELLLFVDFKNDIEISVNVLSTKTNFNGKEIYSAKELMEFAKQAKFPSHGLILRNEERSNEIIYKGITDKKKLNDVFTSIKKQFGRAYVETDMRANYNPSRMKVIKEATVKLVKKINTTCPSCKHPGFAVHHANAGLPCELCNNPTKSTLSYVYACAKCSYVKEKFYPHNKKLESPTYCDFCNP